MLSDRLKDIGHARNQYVRYYRNMFSSPVDTYYDTWDYPLTPSNRAGLLPSYDPSVIYSRMAGDPYEPLPPPPPRVPVPTRSAGSPIGYMGFSPADPHGRHYSSPSSGSSSLNSVENETIGQMRNRTSLNQDHPLSVMIPTEEIWGDDADFSEDSDTDIEPGNLGDALRSLRELEAKTDKLKSDEKRTGNSKEGETSQRGKNKSSIPKTTNEDVPPNFRWVEIEIV